jgi:protease-4
MGSVAGSGGYYVTTPADRVIAHPGTLTGSIGVLAGKVVAGGLLDLLLVGRELVQRGEHAAMWGPEAPFTEAERRKMRELIDRSYRLFLERVAAARGRSVAEIEPVAGGRVWTGRQALEHGLVDELGGLRRAVAEARRLGGLREDAPVRDVRRGRRDLLPEPTAAAAALDHALRALAALRQAGVWWISPLVGEDGG